MKTFVIIVPFVFQFTVPETTADEPKAMRTSLNVPRPLCLSVRLCVSVVSPDDKATTGRIAIVVRASGLRSKLRPGRPARLMTTLETQHSTHNSQL